MLKEVTNIHVIEARVFISNWFKFVVNPVCPSKEALLSQSFATEHVLVQWQLHFRWLRLVYIVRHSLTLSELGVLL